MSASSSTSRLHARTLRARYLVARDHPSPARVRVRLDAVVRSTIDDMLRAAMMDIMAGDDSIWFVRRLEVDVPLDTAWDADRIAAVWARGIASSVRELLRRGPDHDSVVRFANAVEYVGRFLVETARGTAWSRWYFRPFDGLRPLTGSAVLRSVIVRDARHAVEALVGMPEHELALVIEAMSPADAARAAAAIGSDASTGDLECALDEVCRALQAVDDQRGPATCEERVILRTCVELLRAGGRIDQSKLVLCRAVVRLRSYGGSTSERARALIEALAAGAMKRVIELASSLDVEILAPLSRLPGAQFERLASHLPRRSGRDDEIEDGVRHTPFGALFLLLPQLLALPLETACARWGRCGAATAASVIRFLVALAAGSGHVHRDWNDSVARDLMSIPPALTPEHTAAWCASVAPTWWDGLPAGDIAEQLSTTDEEFFTLPRALVGSARAAHAIALVGQHVLRNFARPLRGFAQSSASHLFVNFLDVPATVVDEPTRRIVRIGRSPLDLVLRMAGVGRGMIVVPWLDERPIMLFPADV